MTTPDSAPGSSSRSDGSHTVASVAVPSGPTHGSRSFVRADHDRVEGAVEQGVGESSRLVGALATQPLVDVVVRLTLLMH